MTKRYFDLLESLDQELALTIDELEIDRDSYEDVEDSEHSQDFIDRLEEIRGIINE